MRNHGSLGLKAAAISITAALALGACGGGGSSSASGFCKKLSGLSVQFAGLQDSPSASLVRKAAAAADKLPSSAPGAIKSAVKTEVTAYDEWAKSGNDSEMNSNAFSAADDQINAWTSSNCKQ
jgi:hypothetical protein